MRKHTFGHICADTCSAPVYLSRHDLLMLAVAQEHTKAMILSVNFLHNLYIVFSLSPAISPSASLFISLSFYSLPFIISISSFSLSLFTSFPFQSLPSPRPSSILSRFNFFCFPVLFYSSSFNMFFFLLLIYLFYLFTFKRTCSTQLSPL